jgi:hypothetical protein
VRLGSGAVIEEHWKHQNGKIEEDWPAIASNVEYDVWPFQKQWEWDIGKGLYKERPCQEDPAT